MTVTLLLTSLVFAADPPIVSLPIGRAADPPIDSLPIRTLTLYANGTSWVQRSGHLKVADGSAHLALARNLLAESWKLNVTGSAEKAFRGASLHVAAVNAKATYVLENGSITGIARPDHPFVVDNKNIIAIETKFGITLIKRAAVQSIEPLKSPHVALKFDPTVQTAEIESSGLIAGIGWQPQYRLQLGPEGDALLQLDAALRNGTLEPFASEIVECAIAPPTLDDAETDVNGLAETGRLQVPALTLEPSSTRVMGLSQQVIELSRVYEWNVAGVSSKYLAVPSHDLVNAYLVWRNEADHPLPTGKITVTAGSRLYANSHLPYTAVENNCEVSVGAATDINVQRQETELERKRAVIRRENEEYDFVRVAGTLMIENQRKSTSRIRVIKTFEGEGISASDNGKIQRRPNQIGQNQPVSEIRWQLDIEPGATQKLTYGYELHLVVN